MPSFASTSDVRDAADGLQLVLRARHVFVVGAPSSDAHTVKGRLPDDLDVILESDLVIALTGIANRVKIDAHRVQRSAIAKHLLHYFHVNGEQLGVRPASSIFVDDSDGVAKLTLSPTRPILRPRSAAAVRLSAIELLYTFRTQPLAGAQPHAQTPGPVAHNHADPAASAAADPFSPHAFLPLLAALDRTVERFAVSQLIRRYPLIFGPWRERYDAEVAASQKLARAVADIIARSPHSQFRQQSRRLVKTMRKNCAAASSTSRVALRGLLPDTQAGADESLPLDGLGELSSTADNFDILCHSMERLFKAGPKPARYKSQSSSGVNGSAAKDADDDFTLSECRSESPPAMFRVAGEEGGRCASWAGLDLDLDLDLEVHARDRVELCFDEDEDADAETVGGSQELELGGDLFFSDDEGETSPWDAEELEPLSAPDATMDTDTDDFDDLWASSQSTLDDEAFEWEDRALGLGSSQPLGAASASFSDPYPRPRSPDVFLAHDDDDDDVRGWLDSGRPCPAEAEERLDDLCTQAGTGLQGILELMLVDAVGPQSDSLGLELSFADEDEPGTGLLGRAGDALGATLTGHLPVRAGDDLAYGIGGSRAPPLAPFTLTATHGTLSGESSGRSSDSRTHPSELARARFSSRSPSPEPDATAGRGSPLGSSEGTCPPAARRAIDGGAHGRNEDGLVAGHAPRTIRPGQEGLAKGWAGRALGTRVSDREGGEEGEEDAMLWAE